MIGCRNGMNGQPPCRELSEVERAKNMTDTRALAEWLRKFAASPHTTLTESDRLCDCAEALSTLSTENAEMKRQLAEADQRWRKSMAKRLAPSYRADYLGIANLCDEVLDPSGALLGYVRDASRPSNTGKE